MSVKFFCDRCNQKLNFVEGGDYTSTDEPTAEKRTHAFQNVGVIVELLEDDSLIERYDDVYCVECDLAKSGEGSVFWEEVRDEC